MTGGFFGPGTPGSGPFDEFLARYFGADPRRPVQRVDIGRLLTDPARQLITAAARHVAERGGTDLGAEHLLWAATRTEPTRQLLSRAGADPEALAQEVDALSAAGQPRQEPPALTPAAKRALLDSHQISRALGTTYIGPEHVLLALLANPESPAGRILGAARITPESLERAAMGPHRGGGPGEPPPRPTNTPTVDQFGQDLTELARAGKLDPVVGRAEQIEQTIEVLSRRTKNNPVLIGETGVGKTAIVEGIAQRIVDGDVPDILASRRVVQLNLTGVVAGTRYRGDFEERMTKLIGEIREHGDQLIVFLDELHTLVGAGGSSEGGMDAGNILKPALARGELHVIGTTTLDEYRTGIERDAALERRFQPILVPEPSVADTTAILHGLRDRYEAYHRVRISPEALVAAAELSDRYVTDRFLPDKAIDLIDQAAARVRLHGSTGGDEVANLRRELERAEAEKA
ncbi:MAG: ATP-dependent Clp protease ATP-binding subunit, partial [Actinomycetota bacterium]|nr:ATP-dependent Clp protease ATP-binding subunit [Actinomycetota bacterium]